MKAFLAALSATAVLLGMWTPAHAATSAPYTPRAGTVFNNPKGTRAQQLKIITQIDAALDAAPARSTVTMAQYLFDIDSTADKMIRAHRRGVNVHVLIDDGEKTPQITRVRQALGTDKRKRSFVATCRHSCMANSASVMHAKFYLFSQSGTAKQVSMISSANPYTGNTFKSWNDLHTIVGNSAIYSSLSRYFTDMLKDRNNLNYYRSTESGRHTVFLFPRAPKQGATTVTLLNALNQVSCTGAAKGYGSAGRTVIRVATWGWSGGRIDVARRLWALHNAGCRVQVIYNGGRTSRPVAAALLKPSSRYGVLPVYDAWVDRNHDGVADYYMHLKTMTINGVWYGRRGTKVTYAGSQNLTGPATRVNNDIILRILDGATHDAYARNFDSIRGYYTHRVTKAPSAKVATADRRIEAQANQDGN